MTKHNTSRGQPYFIKTVMLLNYQVHGTVLTEYGLFMLLRVLCSDADVIGEALSQVVS